MDPIAFLRRAVVTGQSRDTCAWVLRSSRNLRGVIKAMDARFPGLGAYLEEETTVAIDGQIHETAYFQRLGEVRRCTFAEDRGGVRVSASIEPRSPIPLANTRPLSAKSPRRDTPTRSSIAMPSLATHSGPRPSGPSPTERECDPLGPVKQVSDAVPKQSELPKLPKLPKLP